MQPDQSGPKITIVTAVFNRANTIASAIESVLAQTYSNIEYIVIDGMSQDGTDQIVNQYSDRISKTIREPDKGIYDALNKGIRMASGDVVGFLHADDLLADSQTVEHIAAAFRRTGCDAVYGGLHYVDSQDPSRIVRNWKPVPYRINRFFWGWMPPHPTCYIRTDCYNRYGMYNQSMSISADYELLVRMMVKHRIQVSSIDKVLVKMRVGGKSNASIKNRLLANREDVQAWTANGLNPPCGLRIMKPGRKLLQYFSRPT
jgi:glycosyltransferase